MLQYFPDCECSSRSSNTFPRCCSLLILLFSSGSMKWMSLCFSVHSDLCLNGETVFTMMSFSKQPCEYSLREWKGWCVQNAFISYYSGCIWMLSNAWHMRGEGVSSLTVDKIINSSLEMERVIWQGPQNDIFSHTLSVQKMSGGWKGCIDI